MKKDRLSLTSILNEENILKNTRRVLGGEQPCGQCSCGCHHVNQGGSGELDNSTANFKLGLHSPEGGWSCCDNTLAEQNKYLSN